MTAPTLREQVIRTLADLGDTPDRIAADQPRPGGGSRG